MLTVEVRYDDGVIKIRRFGNGDFKRWTILKPGDEDHLTGWSFDRLRGLGEGIWEFASCLPAIAAGA